MKRLTVLLLVLVLPILVSCTTVPNTGVSLDSYRLAVTRADTNLSGIVAKLKALKADDQNQATPRHSTDWWDAQIGLADDTLHLLDATLSGSTTTTAVPK